MPQLYSSFILFVEKNSGNDTTFLLEFLKEKTPKTNLVKVRDWTLWIINKKNSSDGHIIWSLVKTICRAYFRYLNSWHCLLCRHSNSPLSLKSYQFSFTKTQVYIVTLLSKLDVTRTSYKLSVCIDDGSAVAIANILSNVRHYTSTYHLFFILKGT